MDLAKAFDVTQRYPLQSVQIQNWSEFVEYANGVRQGYTLPPTLFNLYLDEIFFLLNKQDTPILYHGSSLNCLSCTDDLILIFHLTTRLRNALSTYILSIFHDWMMKINTKNRSCYFLKET